MENCNIKSKTVEHTAQFMQGGGMRRQRGAALTGRRFPERKSVPAACADGSVRKCTAGIRRKMCRRQAKEISAECRRFRRCCRKSFRLVPEAPGGSGKRRHRTPVLHCFLEGMVSDLYSPWTKQRWRDNQNCRLSFDCFSFLNSNFSPHEQYLLLGKLYSGENMV